MKPCFVVPVFDHGAAIGDTVAALKRFGLPCYLVDDGSGEPCATALDAIAAREAAWVRLLRHGSNRGKGAAVLTGCAAAQADGCTHALQVDADGQHDLADVPKLLALSARNPEALVTGVPIYDASVPKSRFYGRYVTHVWVWINTLSLEIRDSMCGFRVYPIAATLAAARAPLMSRRMAFDTEILVRLWWRGTPVRELPTRVTYPRDGVSHFDVLWDNVRISGMHARLFLGMVLRLPWLLGRLVTRHFGAAKNAVRALAVPVLAVAALSFAPRAPAAGDVFEQPATTARLERDLGSVAATLREARTLRGRYVQERTLREIPRPLVARGTYVFARDLGIAWRTETPFPSDLVITRDRIVQSDGDAVTRLSADQQPGVRAVASVFFAVFALDFRALGELFDLHSRRTAAGWELGLKPKPGFGGAVATIVVSGTTHVERLVLHDKTGDRTEIRLLDARGSGDGLTAEERRLFDL